MTRRNFALFAGLACAAALATVPAMADGKPDFSGDWKLNVDKSNFGPIPPPTSSSLKVDHQDPVLKVTTTQSAMDGDHTDAATYKTDGTESKNDFRGSEAKSVAKWEADNTLVIDTKVDFQGTEITLKSIWKLSEDGKTFNQATKIMTPQGDFDMASVYEKIAK
jgi:hypothetical protein